MTGTPDGMILPLPLLDEAAAALCAGGQYRHDLTDAELARVLGLVVGGLAGGQEKVRVRVSGMDVRIAGGRCAAEGGVRVESPLKATIGIRAVLENDARPGYLRLAELRIEQDAGFIARQALKAMDLDGQARRALSDPNAALAEALRTQLAPRGAQLTALGLHLGERTLTVDMRGGPAGTR